MRATLAGGEFSKMLEKAGNAPIRDYERNMQVSQVKRDQNTLSVHDKA